MQSHPLRWDDYKMGTTISCTECSKVAGLIQKVGENSLKASSLHAAVVQTSHAVLLYM